MKTRSLVPILPLLALCATRADSDCLVDIATDPPGATIRIDSLPQGPLGSALASGAHTAHLSAAGYADTSLAFHCDTGTVSISVQLGKAMTDSVKSGRGDSIARVKREYARKTLAQSADDIAAALEKISSSPAIQRDTASPPTLAVLPFQAVGGAPPEAASTASETVILQLSGDKRWRLVERERFQNVLQEQALWGATGSELELGRSLEARYLLMGTVAADGMRRMVAMRLVDAQNGRVLAVGTSKVDGPKMDEALKDALGEKFGATGAVFRSMTMPGWGQFWTGRPVRGSIWLLATAGLAGTLAWSIVDWADKDNAAEDYKNKDASTFRAGEYDEWLSRANKAVADRNDAADRNLILGSALAGVWALNVADAAWCGWKSARSTRERYFAFAPVVGPDAVGLRMSLSLGGTTR